MNAGVVRMLLRPAPGQNSTLVIPAVAFATATALVLTVVGGAQSFWRPGFGGDDAMIYQVLATVALVLLVIPLASLGGAAARLSARRRDERLSTLRLLGVTPAGVGAITVIESTTIAAIGTTAGLLGYLALVPLVGLVPFRGEALGAGSVLLSPLATAAVCAGAVLLAALSAVLGLRRVIVSPLGVRTRAAATPAHWLRGLLAALLLAAAFLTAQIAPSLAQIVGTTVVVTTVFGSAMAVLSLIGPWALKLLARGQVKRAQRPERLLAARTVLDDPKAAWRQVGGIAMASFIAVFAGAGVSLIDVMSSGHTSQADQFLAADMRTGLIITLVVSFLMVAASVGVTHASDALDQRPIHRSLHQLGVPERTVDAARRRAIMSPLLFTALGSALCATVVVLPLIGITLIIAPLSLLTIAAILAAGILTVLASTYATRPLLRSAFV